MNIRSFVKASPFLLFLGCSQIVATTATVDTLNSDIPKDYLRIECDLLPIVRTTRHGSHPNIPSKVTVPSKEKRSIIGYSTNWSGYVAETNFTNPAEKSVTAVSGTWVVPTIYSSPQNSYCSLWVGIDGFSSASVEQIGTEHDWINGAMQHYAWFEMYPGPSYLINGFPLNVGDVITATVNYTSNNIFLMRLYNVTKKIVTTIPTKYTTSATAQRKSAEWIVEAPYLNGILPLANFKLTHLTNCKATINGVSGYLDNAAWACGGIDMITTTGAKKDTTSNISGGGYFSVTWQHS